MSGEYENLRRISYEFDPEVGTMVCIPVCPNCGRFVKADEWAYADTENLNATCSKCGRISMPSEGFI